MTMPWLKSKEDMYSVYSRLGLIANLGPDMASNAGVKLEDFIISCRYMGGSCNVSTSFEKVFDPYYFNCFTFIPTSVINSANRLLGMEYGLSVLLFVGSAGQLTVSSNYDYIIPGMEETDPALTSGAGARVVVHTPHTIPHTTAEGFDIPPGFAVTIGVKARENVRIAEPHGNCSNWQQENVTFRYTLLDCQINCIQKRIMEQCGCVDNTIAVPDSNHGLPFCLKLPEIPEECYIEFDSRCMSILTNWSSTIECKKELYNNMTIVDPNSVDDCGCYPPCNDIVYDALYSLSTIPEKTEEHTAFYSVISQFLEEDFPMHKRAVLKKKHGEEYSD